MPRRRQTPKPSAGQQDETIAESASQPSVQPAKPKSSSTTSTSQSTTQSKPSSALTKSRAATESDFEPDFSGLVGSNVSQFDLAMPIDDAFFTANTKQEAREGYFVVKSEQLTSDLATRPLLITDKARVRKITIKKGMPAYPKSSTISISLDRPITAQQIQNACTGAFYRELCDRINEPIKKLYEGLPNNNEMMSVVMKTQFTDTGPTMPLKFEQKPGGCEITALARSIVCTADRQAPWEAFLREMNQLIASLLPTNSVTDSSGQLATQVILSNHERKLLITMKFARPVSPANERWRECATFALSLLVMMARQAELMKDPVRNKLDLEDLKLILIGHLRINKPA